MWRLMVKAKASLLGLRGWRLSGRAHPAALLAAGAVLVVGAAALLIPQQDVPPTPMPVVEANPGGETVIPKFAEAKTQTNLFAEPTPVGRLLSMALAPVPTLAPPPEAEPNLAGLSEIPKELIWNRPPETEEEQKERKKAFANFSRVSEQLPWDAVEPVPFSPIADAAAPAQGPGKKTQKVATQGPPVQVASAEVGKWLKAKVTEIKGSDRSRPLYHFELWMEPPAAVKGRLVGVSYTFNTPAIRPQSQASSDRASGFRISAGGLACADKIDLTLRFDDGRVERVSVDGCELLS